jgi:hypothetical protein
MTNATMQTATPAEIAAQRRRVRNTALRLAAFAVAVYVAFIVAFINSRQ